MDAGADGDDGLVEDPRLAEWTRDAVADRITAGEPARQAELHGYADAVHALKLVRQIEASQDTASTQAKPRRRPRRD